MFGFLRRKETLPAAENLSQPLELLVIAADRDKADWVSMMRDDRLADGRPLRVIQCGWDDIMVSAEPSSSVPLVVHIRPSREAPSRPRTAKPDFVLVRNEVAGTLPAPSQFHLVTRFLISS